MQAMRIFPSSLFLLPSAYVIAGTQQNIRLSQLAAFNKLEEHRLLPVNTTIITAAVNQWGQHVLGQLIRAPMLVNRAVALV